MIINNSFISTGDCTVTVTKERFPYLNCENLSTEEMNRLKARLRVESKDILYEFAHLLSKTEESLSGNKRIILQPLRRLLRDYEILKVNESDDEISKILYKAFDHCHFYNFRILKLIINRFGTTEDKDRLATYEANFKHYCERRLCEVPIDAVATGKSEEKQFYVKTDKVFNVPFKEIQDTEAELEKILNKPIYLEQGNVNQSCHCVHIAVS